MVREVLTYPHPMLRRVCQEASEDFLAAIAEDLWDTMRAHQGCVGLAAPQIGEPVRVAVVDVRHHRLTTSSNGPIVLSCPDILDRQGHHVAREGCLSLPDITADVERATMITVYTAVRGELWSEGFEARAIQHELDHLDGVLILDRITSLHALYPRRRPSPRHPT